jgi:CDP-glucose 4,6-dehydratase
MGAAQMEKLPDFIAARQRSLCWIYEGLKPYEEFLILPTWHPQADVSWFAFPITVRSGVPFARQELTDWLEQRNIETRFLFAGDIRCQPACHDIPHRAISGLPKLELTLEGSFFIGVYPGLDHVGVDHALEASEGFFASHYYAIIGLVGFKRSPSFRKPVYPLESKYTGLRLTWKFKWMDKAFWKGKKVLITGHTGFKGSWLSLWLQSLKANVVGYALAPPTTPSLFEIAHVADGMTSTSGDTRDLEHLQAVIVEHRPEIIIHLAAQALVTYSYRHPVETYATNVMGTVNVLEAVRQSEGVRAVVSVTSDKCYQDQKWLWGYRENDPIGGYDPYSSSKGCSELVISAYRNCYFSAQEYKRHGVALASARAGNVIGGGDWAEDRLVPDIMRAFMADRPVVIRHPDAIRPWQHVLEPLNGYLTVAEKLWEHGPEFAQAWNFGPDDASARPVSEVVERLAQLWGKKARWELDSAPHVHEAIYQKLDCSKARSLLGWSPRLSLPTALEWIVEWYRGYRCGEDMRDLTQAQIVRYEDAEVV